MIKPKNRPLDQFRQAAAIPLHSWRITSERQTIDGPVTWTLEVEEALVSRWLETDAPGLGAFLDRTLIQLHGAWHLARTELGVVKKKVKGGKESGKTRRHDAQMKSDDEILAAADDLHARNKKLSKSEVARRLEHRGFGRWSAIRKRLKNRW